MRPVGCSVSPLTGGAAAAVGRFSPPAAHTRFVECHLLICGQIGCRIILRAVRPAAVCYVLLFPHLTTAWSLRLASLNRGNVCGDPFSSLLSNRLPSPALLIWRKLAPAASAPTCTLLWVRRAGRAVSTTWRGLAARSVRGRPAPRAEPSEVRHGPAHLLRVCGFSGVHLSGGQFTISRCLCRRKCGARPLLRSFWTNGVGSSTEVSGAVNADPAVHQQALQCRGTGQPAGAHPPS